jgi:hypothetical protein
MSSLKTESLTFCSCCALQLCDCLHLFLSPSTWTYCITAGAKKKKDRDSFERQAWANCLPASPTRRRRRICDARLLSRFRSFCWLCRIRSLAWASRRAADGQFLLGAGRRWAVKERVGLYCSAALLPGLVIFLGLIYVGHEVL